MLQESNNAFVTEDVDVRAQRVQVLTKKLLSLLDDLLGLPHEALWRERWHLVLVKMVLQETFV